MQRFQRLQGALTITRPGNALAAGLLTFIGTFVAGDPTAAAAGAAVLATILATGAGMAINDYIDRDIDAINRPERPIPSGVISARWALWQSILLFFIAVALALTLPPLAIGIAAINLVALVSYTSLFKQLPGVGNLVVALLSGSTFLFGGAAVGNISETVILFVLAAFASLGREIIKDVEDIVGDRAEGLQTLPIAIGPRRATWIAGTSLAIATVASPLPYLTSMFGRTYLIVVTPAIGVMLYGFYRSFAEPGVGQRAIKTGMYLAIIAFVVGSASVPF